MFEPDPPKERAGLAYEHWVAYWYKKFELTNNSKTRDPEYWHDCRMFIEQRWYNALRKLYGTQKSNDLPNVE